MLNQSGHQFYLIVGIEKANSYKCLCCSHSMCPIKHGQRYLYWHTLFKAEQSCHKAYTSILTMHVCPQGRKRRNLY